jgi:hypothetical protein
MLPGRLSWSGFLERPFRAALVMAVLVCFALKPVTLAVAVRTHLRSIILTIMVLLL